MDTARLFSVPNDLTLASPPLLRRPCDLFGRQLQHRLDRRSPHDVHQIINGHPGLCDQLHHGQYLLPILGKELG